MIFIAANKTSTVVQIAAVLCDTGGVVVSDQLL